MPIPGHIGNLNGVLAFHSYNRYGDGTSRLFMFDFRNNDLICPSDSWKSLRDPMNAHFSPEGRRLVFMGVSNTTGCWDCFLHELGSSEEPVNLTASLCGRNEDPKFSPCGSKIVFKHEWKELVETDESGNHFRAILFSDKEIGMPYYMEDGERLLFSNPFFQVVPSL